MLVVCRQRGWQGVGAGPAAMTSLQDMEGLLYEAVLAQDLSAVKRLVNSGIGLNAVLHSARHVEPATVLSLAAYHAHLPVVRYLVQSGAAVNFRNPGLQHTALHWACMGGGTEVVRYLIANGAHVDALDRDNLSPLMQAAMHSHPEAVQTLVEAGACVNFIDRLRCSALHYAAFHGDRRSVRSLILGGCVHNNAIFVKGTPLSNLAGVEDVDNVRLLLSAGCRVGSEDFEGLPDDSEIGRMVRERAGQAPSLRQLCRGSIRGCMKGQGVQRKIAQLPLPPSLIQYLLLL